MGKQVPIHIILPESCNEDWNKMRAAGHGRHCDKCQHAVVDFSGLNDEELYDLCKKYANGRICGRFRLDQLGRNIPAPTLRSAYRSSIWAGVGLTLLLLGNSAEAFPKVPFINNQIKIADNDTPDLVNDDYVSVCGKTIDINGKAVSGVKVMLIRENVSIGAGITNEHGQFRIDSVKKGICHLLVICPGYYPVRQEAIMLIDTNTNLNEIILKKDSAFDIGSKKALTTGMVIDDYPNIKPPSIHKKGWLRRWFRNK